MSANRPRRRPRWQRTVVIAFTWVLLVAFVLTSVGVAFISFSVH